MKKRKKLKLDVLRAAARDATRSALMDYPQFARVPMDGMTLGTMWDGDTVVFELYIPRDRPEDALVLTTAKVDSHSGKVLSVQVHENGWRNLAQQSVAADRRENAAPAER